MAHPEPIPKTLDGRPKDREDYQIILVHGTQSVLKRLSSRWIDESSEFCRRLTATFPLARIQTLEWSGANRVLDRTAAAERLGLLLNLLRTQYPDRKIFVVAHSHGGNVALQAAANFGEEERLTGVACLSTPFVISGPRRWAPLGATGAYMLSCLAITFLLHAAMQFGVLQAPAWPTQILLALFVGLGLHTLARTARRRLQARADRVAEQMRPPDRGSVPCEVLRAPGDEASAALSFAQIMTWLAANAANAAVYVSQTMARVAVCSVVFAVMFVGGYSLGWRTDLRDLTVAFRLLSPYLMFAGWAVTAALFGAILGVAVSYRLFGRDAVVASLFYDLSVEQTPAGEWTITQLAFSADKTGIGNTDNSEHAREPHVDRLRHGRTHEDPQAVAILTRWMKTTADKPDPPEKQA